MDNFTLTPKIPVLEFYDEMLKETDFGFSGTGFGGQYLTNSN